MRNWMIGLALLPLLGGVSLAQDDFQAMDAPALVAAAPTIHPAGLYVLAGKLFAEGRKDEAVFWFYAGQLRYRVHLACHPDLDPSGEPALFGALSETVGRPLNEYAFGDVPALAKTLDRVLAWDAETPDATTDRKTCTAVAGVRDGLAGLRDQILAEVETIRTTREKNGLENR